MIPMIFITSNFIDRKINLTEYINDMALFLLNDEKDIFEIVYYLYQLL